MTNQPTDARVIGDADDKAALQERFANIDRMVEEIKSNPDEGSMVAVDKREFELYEAVFIALAAARAALAKAEASGNCAEGAAKTTDTQDQLELIP